MSKGQMNKQRLEYLDKNVRPILEPLLFNITKEKPENPILYAITWLRKLVGEDISSENIEKEELKRLRKELKYYKKKYKDEDDLDSDSKENDSEEEIDEEEKKRIDEEVKSKMKIRQVAKKFNRTSVSAEVYGIYNKLGDFKPKVFKKTEEQRKK